MLLNVLRSRPGTLACTVGIVASATAASYATTAGSNLAETAPTGKVKLTYPHSCTRTFMIRAALHHAGIPFEDNRISLQDLTQLRGPTGANENVPLGQLPLIEFPNGEDFNQALLVDEVVESVAEFRGKIPDSKDPTERLRLREEYIANVLPKYLDYLTRRLNKSDGPFFLGNQFSMADLYSARIIDGFVQKKFEPLSRETFEKWPRVLQHYDAVRKHPIYANEVKVEDEYQKSRKAAL